jgi:hypothetical protein
MIHSDIIKRLPGKEREGRNGANDAAWHRKHVAGHISSASIPAAAVILSSHVSCRSTSKLHQLIDG